MLLWYWYASLPDSGLKGINVAATHQELVARHQHRLQHGLVEQKVAHPLGHDDVHLLDAVGQLDILHLALDEGHDVVQLVHAHDLLRLVNNAAAVHADDALGARLGGKHAQDARAAPHVQHHLPLEEVGVLDNAVHVGARAHLVLQHLLVDAKVRIAIKVVIGAVVLCVCRGGGWMGTRSW